MNLYRETSDAAFARAERRAAENAVMEAAALESAAMMEASVVMDAAAVAEAKTAILQRLLSMANGYLATRSFHQAADIFFELVEKDPGTLEAVQARKSLLDIGEIYERSGEMHQARSIYERLLNPPPQ